MRLRLPAMIDELSHVVHLPVLGVMTRFESNSESVIEQVLALYGSWAKLDRSIVSPSGATVRIVVREEAAPAPDTLPRYHVSGPTRLTVEWPGVEGSADTAKLESLAVVNTAMVTRGSELGEGVIEPLTLFLLGALDREPLHAGAVMRDGVAILLAGASGAGKSTLAYAACRNGHYSLLANEPVYVQTRPVLRVWGRRARIHLQADTCAHFPELCDLPARQLFTGKSKIVLDLESGARYADQMGICLLSRAPGKDARLERLTPAQVMAELGTCLEPGYDLFAHSLRERLARIAERGAWRLHVGSSPGAVVPLLDDVVAELATRT